MNDKPRCVFDTGVLVSAVIFKESTPGQAFQAALKTHVILLSRATAQELREVLARPKFDRYIHLSTRMRFLAALLRRAAIVEVEQSFHACRDPKDDKFLELAVAGNASFLVTGDEDLLVLSPFHGVAVVTPAEFLAVAAA
ncbi:MAG: putative toxin-antitoxin system toxin component, PIN family [Pirellulales bacterium]